ncbi:MAG: beta-ketoacyl synthase N-terminal-like domain-containing protein [Lentisphaeria bacterium]
MKIRVDGLGLFCSLGKNPEEVYQRMCAGEDAFRPIWRFSSEPYQQKKAGQISVEADELLREKYPDNERTGALLKEAASQAVQHLNLANPDEKLALVLASNFGPLEAQEWLWRERMDTGSIAEDSFAMAEEFLSGIAQDLGCGGAKIQLSMSCASGLAAASVARDLLLQGRAEHVLVAAYDLLSEFSWCGLHNLRTITTDTMRPFDRRRSGTIFSEGAAAVLLSKETSVTEKIAPLAFLSSAVTNNNAFHITAPLPDAEGSRLVMAEALRLAGMVPDDIEHICAHATSTVANDKTEAVALRNLFGEHLTTMTVAAHKSQLGHLLGAAGLAEIIITILAMQHSIIPPTMNHQELDPDCAGIDCIPGKARYRQIRSAIINSAGIGGNNSAAVLTHGSY